MSFKDHFSGHASEYARFRPRYPEALFAYLASIVPERRCAWDCATGNGQAAVPLAEHFTCVVATDASAQQIGNATPHERVEYRVASAESSGLEDGSIDLVTVAQALHWFDIPAFLDEARRVLQPGGICAAWGYNLMTISPEIDPLIQKFYRDTTGPFWPPERAIVEAGYRTIDFRFEELAPPKFQMETRWSLDEVLGYLRTWSATQKFIRVRGVDPVDSLGEEMSALWPEAESARRVEWPLSLRVGRKPSTSTSAIMSRR